MCSLLWLFAVLYSALPVLSAGLPGLPPKLYGVNLGSWLVLEPWMLPQGWLDMGGQQCDDCSTCIASEFAFAQAFPKTVDATFKKHWETWFNQADVKALAENGINIVRIPLGYWIIEPLVDRRTEFYPRGGLEQLRRGLEQLKAAGIVAILDHHGLPGVQDPNQMFTGRCTTDTPHNYHRALVWTSVMTTLVHLDPSFTNAVAIQAASFSSYLSSPRLHTPQANEPIMDASQTPGYGDFQKNFVRTVRATEFLLGVHTPGFPFGPAPSAGTNYSQALPNIADTEKIFTEEIRAVLRDAALVLVQMGLNRLVPGRPRGPIITNFMDRNWQFNHPANPAEAALGPQGYDNHLYYVYVRGKPVFSSISARISHKHRAQQGVADANPDAYLKSICSGSFSLWFRETAGSSRFLTDLKRVEADAALGNSPLWFGEWGLPTEFEATDEFLRKWADAQKLAYSKGAGWIFWNFKVENSPRANNLSREWSYLDGVRLGYLTKDPSQYHDANVCVPYVSVSHQRLRPTHRAMALLAVTVLLGLSSLAAAAPAPVLEPRQAITPLSAAQVASFKPYTFYASAAYCAPASTLAWNCGANCAANPTFTPVASGGDGNGVQFWYVGWDPKLATVIVAHQGTDFSQILAAVTDANFFMESLDPTLFPGLSGLEAHSGFADEQAKTATTILNAVNTAIARFGAKKVTVVGHSLGGALALLDSVYLPLHISGITFQTITYGMPRVGNQAFADHASIGSTVTHINNQEDIVPILPGRFLGFHHPTGEVHIQDSGVWDACPGEDNTSNLCSTGDVPTIFSGDTDDHDGPYDGVFMGC
ncbi:Glycoside hydrolase family 5 protein [Mycena kentingensis (nom. inval.)]|nr:Glycoside hydrolase family 5 protein [Mycena kentingensis (nom. inval.)]